LTHKACSEAEGFSGVKNGNEKEWLLSAVYASPDAQVRKPLWGYLKKLDDAINFPWLVVGDLNEVVSGNEKQGGRAVCLVIASLPPLGSLGVIIGVAVPGFGKN